MNYRTPQGSWPLLEGVDIYNNAMIITNLIYCIFTIPVINVAWEAETETLSRDSGHAAER